MLLVTKISRTQLANYRDEILKCLIHNSSNVFFQEIYVFTDEVDHKIVNIPKVKVLFKRKMLSTYELVKECKKSSRYNKIVLSEPFVQFQEDLYKVVDEDLLKKVFKNSDYTIFSKKSKISPQGNFEMEISHINLSTIKLNVKKDTNYKNSNSDNNILVKKSVPVSNKINASVREKKLDVIIVSVNYNDYLLLSLVNNLKIFDNITVITTKEDLVCQRICKNLKIKCVISERIFEDGAKFNKGKAINDGIKSLSDPDFILLLDADIIVKEKIELNTLADDVLYTSNRTIYKDYNSFLNQSDGFVEVDKGWGFFQLFCMKNSFLNKDCPFPENSETAAGSDLIFRDFFEKKMSIEKKVVHIGDTKQNWKGRSSEKFITEEEFEQILEENTFDINKYFDKIYCLNLDKRKDRWHNVTKQFDKFDIQVDRWSAVDGDNIDDKLLDYYNPQNLQGEEASFLGIIENKNAIGCLLSHLQIIKDAKEKNYKKILIFEDDILISNDFFKKIKEIKNKYWDLLYLGASQFDWSSISILGDYYKCSGTLGTFAYAVNSVIFDDLIDLFQTGLKSVDNLFSDFQKKNQNCFTIYPNIVISDVESSDIRVSKELVEYSNICKWNLKDFNLLPIKVLLLPDTPGWAFDNIAKAIKRYNPYPNKVFYEIDYIRNIHHGKQINYDDYDFIYVFFEGEKSVKLSRKVIRGCYSAFWLENSNYSQENIAKDFSLCGGYVFANEFLKNEIMKYLPSEENCAIIEDSSDETLFYKIDGMKRDKFTAIFVGNSKRKVKNFEQIKHICNTTDIELIVCEDIQNEDLVNHYNQADICINFSTFEGGPQTFIESALCEVPMLIRKNNEFSKVIPCFTGETVEDFIKVIEFLKENRNFCQIKGKEAKEVSKNKFTYQIASQRFTKFFMDLDLKNQQNEK